MTKRLAIRRRLLISATLAPLAWAPVQAMAQAKPDDANGGLQEIVVTAQKREQSMQDVPIAITALTQDTLQANRVYNVNDLSGLAPGLTVRPSAGGIQTPSFTMRGQVSFGVVAGSDKQISIYLDGVYLSNPRGSIFDLPDVARIEVLRGPQGTLFGRNATGGAVSVTTRDPMGEPHIKAEGTYGNDDQYRVRMTVDTPQMGPFSAYFSFVRRYKHGDIRNANPGIVWDRASAGPDFGVRRSSEWLGTVDSNSYFAAVKFEPSDSFKIIYKYDRNEDHGTPEGTGFVGYDPNAPLTGSLVTALLTSQPFPVYTAPDGKRPDVVNNGWVTPRNMLVQGHSATATWLASDNLTVKDVFAYRKSFVFATSSIDGLSSLVFTPQTLVPYATLIAFSSIGKVPGITDVPSAIKAIPGFVGRFAPLVGGQFVLIGTESTSRSEQWSDELQVNFHTDKLQLTAGALWFHSKDIAGGPNGLAPTYSLTAFPVNPADAMPNGLIPPGRVGEFHSFATSLAAYLQLEYDITDKLSVVGGARITHDKKTSTFAFGTPGSLTTINPPAYTKTKPNWLIGINYKPSRDILVYGKYSTSFVSGGSTGGIPYQPETASSFEVGLKADLLDRHLRTNLALFHVIYNHFQSPQGTTQLSSSQLATSILEPIYGEPLTSQIVPALSTFVVDQGKIRAQGVELEVTGAPVRGVQVGGSLGYTDVKFPYVTPVVLAVDAGAIQVTNRPKWTGTLWGMYESQPLFDDATLMLRADATYQSRMALDPQAIRTVPQLEPARFVPPYWTLNARVALQHIKLGPLQGELAVWGKNLTDTRAANFALIQSIATSANYIPARSYGLDFGIEF